jgi:hypothetical protein
VPDNNLSSSIDLYTFKNASYDPYMFTSVDIISLLFLFADIKKSIMSLFNGNGSQFSAAASSSSELIYPPSSNS